MRPTSPSSSLGDIKKRLTQADEHMAAMLREQRAYEQAHKGERWEAFRHAFRRFSEEHYGFLNAAYSVGDYLARAVVRQYLRAEVKPFLDAPLARFHRKLRDSVDHGRVLDYGRSYNVHVQGVLRPATTFPIPDVRVAAAYGMVTQDQQINLGPEFFVYLAHHLDADLVPLLKALKKLTGAPGDLSVVLAAERYIEGLRSLSVRAESDGWLKP